MGILSNIKILNDLKEEELNSLELLCQERFIKSGELLFKEGDEASSMYLLSKGKIEVFSKKGRTEVVLGYIKAEEILGEMALFGERHRRMAGARAIEDSVVIIMLDFAIKELALKYPLIMDKIKNIIENRKEINKKLL